MRVPEAFLVNSESLLMNEMTRILLLFQLCRNWIFPASEGERRAMNFHERESEIEPGGEGEFQGWGSQP